MKGGSSTDALNVRGEHHLISLQLIYRKPSRKNTSKDFVRVTGSKILEFVVTVR